MPRGHRLSCGLVLTVIAAGGIGWQGAYGQDTPTNDAPNPYRTIEGWAKLPDGRKWGSTSSVDIDRDGKTVWAAERCGANSCLDRTTGEIKNIDTIFHFDENGNVIKSFGAGMVIFPHGIYVDKQDNVWITDGQDNAPLPAG